MGSDLIKLRPENRDYRAKKHTLARTLVEREHGPNASAIIIDTTLRGRTPGVAKSSAPARVLQSKRAGRASASEFSPSVRVHWRVHYGLKNMGHMVLLCPVSASS
jgi:hypothetical protein